MEAVAFLGANAQKKDVHTATQTSEASHYALYNYGTLTREERQSIVPHLSPVEGRGEGGTQPTGKLKELRPGSPQGRSRA